VYARPGLTELRPRAGHVLPVAGYGTRVFRSQPCQSTPSSAEERLSGESPAAALSPRGL